MGSRRSKKDYMKPRRMPVRTCIGCRETGPKNGLVRIVRGSAGVQVDHTGKQDGRGAYMHAQRGCWERALKSHQVALALRMEIGLQDRRRLESYFSTLPGHDSQKVIL